MTTIYVASKARHAPWWRALQAAGVPISATWVDWDGNRDGAEPTSDAWRHHWSRCITESASADITLFVANEGETACGALLEASAALAAGKQVYVVSDYEFTFAHHPQCRSFPSIEEAIGAIMAGAHGAPRRTSGKWPARNHGYRVCRARRAVLRAFAAHGDRDLQTSEILPWYTRPTPWARWIVRKAARHLAVRVDGGRREAVWRLKCGSECG